MTSDGIEKLIDIVGNKYEETIHITENSSEIRVKFNTPIQLDPNKNYKIAVKYFSVYNSIYNITAENNELRYKINGEWKTFKLDHGAYEVKNINERILNDANIKDNIVFFPDTPTGRAMMKLKSGVEVDFKHEKSFRDLLGFNKKIYTEPSNLAENMAKINLDRSLINITCDCINSGYIKSKKLYELGNIIYSIPTYTVPPGYKITETPHKPEYLRITKSQLKEINLRVVDENDVLHDFNNEEIVIKLHIKQV